MVRQIKRGDIYIADLEPVRGSEEGKTRRVLVVSNDIGNVLGPTVIALPITGEVTDKRLKMPMYVRLTPTKDNGQTKEALIDCGQIRVLSKGERLLEYKGYVNKTVIDKVDSALEICLALKRCYKCDHVLMLNRRHCPNCKELQSDVCSSCFKEVNSSFSFCPHCGNKKGGEHE
ncbi:type II toxin-antitoxin system PemK/MazF family toxin [Paenibacillus sp. 19GGS1-52]|uniref:type II toxin-antitoxin system PemK/MazF family toxin n=1 Tax=Paenibacillus sp. 19GGS1-52 TaxID=2758563 RepID=UPI001EFAA313|nr:type II toxin-antitoxin system PemK/MazF family toxin [Paenibacillus sp. 19GGS1-52]ULO05150.1 type II toxin-antitoxin system PemK/MazF family toxin [Paenibacillus sp. 19GGS1-52]